MLVEYVVFREEPGSFYKANGNRFFPSSLEKVSHESVSSSAFVAELSWSELDPETKFRMPCVSRAGYSQGRENPFLGEYPGWRLISGPQLRQQAREVRKQR